LYCKPKIRKAAKIGEWISGTGSTQFGFENQLVFAMKVTGKMTFEEYDNYCKNKLHGKIPVKGLTKDLRKKVGDCIYDYTAGEVKLRDWGVHQKENMQTDLKGEFVLLSDHFYYFGSEPIPLPRNLLKIVKQSQGHKSVSNATYIGDFIEWINSTFRKKKNQIVGKTFGLELFEKEDYKNECSKCHLEGDEADKNGNDV
jgi:hypothetical protein